MNQNLKSNDKFLARFFNRKSLQQIENELNINIKTIEILDNIEKFGKEQSNQQQIQESNLAQLNSQEYQLEIAKEVSHSEQIQKSIVEQIKDLKKNELQISEINEVIPEDQAIQIQAFENIPSDEKQDKITFSDFQVCKEIGSGAFGKIYLVQKKDNGKIYAMKALFKKRLILSNKLKYAVSEANILKSVDHPFCIKMHYAFQTAQYLYFIIDYCPGGDLLLQLVTKKTFTLNEAKFYIAELILSIEHLHNLNIIYRDLKPENILLDYSGHIKITDFGLSKENVTQDELSYSFCGSPAYLSPEMLKRKGTGRAADIYGIGAILYEMLIGMPPFFNPDMQKMYKSIKDGKLKFPKWIQPEAKSLIESLMNPEPKLRIGINDKSQIKQHPFFKGIDFNLMLEKKYQPPKIQLFDMDLDMKKLPVYKLKDADYKAGAIKTNHVKNFTFVREQNQKLEEEENEVNQ